MNKGFTLIETLVYIALFGILMSGGLLTTYSLLEGGKSNQSSSAVQEEGTFLNRKINWALTGASDATVAGGKLTITRPDLGSESPIVVAASGTAVTLKRGSGAAVPLTGIVNVSALTFTRDAASGGVPTAITVRFNVERIPFVFKKYLQK